MAKHLHPCMCRHSDQPPLQNHHPALFVQWQRPESNRQRAAAVQAALLDVVRHRNAPLQGRDGGQESLPRTTTTDRGPTPYTYSFRAGVPISLTEYASPVLTGEVKIRSDLGVFAQDQWTVHRLTFNLGLRYEYHRTKADPIDTLAGPLVDAHSSPGLDCIPCWHDLDPRLGVVWDVFGDGKTAVKANLGRYVGLVSWVMSKTFNPQNAIVASTSRSWNDLNNNLVPDCDLRNPNANGECSPMANKNFGQ